MFGLKIRSWMENHIVRPRKKGNKNKNGNSGNLVTSINTQNGHKGIQNQGDSSIGSPARRSEVSPIQNHTTSRVGWQSPQDDDIYPKSESNFPYMVKSSTTSPKNMDRLNNLHSTHEPYNVNNLNNSQYSKSVDAKYLARTYEMHTNTVVGDVIVTNNQQRKESASTVKLTTACPTTSLTINSAATNSVTTMPNRSSVKYCSNTPAITTNASMANHQRYAINEMLEQQRTFSKYERVYINDDKIGYNRNHNTTMVNQSQFPSNDIRSCTNNRSDNGGALMKMTKHDEQQKSLQNYHLLTDQQQHPFHYHLEQSKQQNNQPYYYIDRNHAAKSEQPTNIYQPNGFLMKHSMAASNGGVGNNNNNNNNRARDEFQVDFPNDDIIISKSLNENRYGKLLNRSGGSVANANISKEHFNRNNGCGSRPMPMLPPPPSTPPPPLTSSDAVFHDGNQYHQHDPLNANANNKFQIKTSTANTNENIFGDSSNNNNNNVIINHNCTNNNNSTNSVRYYTNGCLIQQATGKTSHSAAKHHHHHQYQQELASEGNCIDTQNGLENPQEQTIILQQQNHHHRHHHKTRYGNGTHFMAPGNHQLAHVINSLSSPESAYSTGYSTDGTSPSPGTTNTPEYYINMRTGTHYFPRGVTGVASVERNRQKFGLNKIEETVGETMIISSHRRTESCDLGKRQSHLNSNKTSDGVAVAKENFGFIITSGMSPDLQRRLAYQNYKGLESPSPRQRCRIRTNPWFSNADATTMGNGNVMKKMDIDTSSTSSGIKSSSDAGTDEKPCKKPISSESESSSSTEIEVSRKSFSPNTIRKRKQDKQLSDRERLCSQLIGGGESEDEDATFNELMGKFDESYVYEKETDILSDSDPTECISDLDTGQDGGDECDTDELLDIDFIDNGSIQEIVDKDLYKNTGSCTYYQHTQPDKKPTKLRKSRKSQSEENGSKRKKKLTRTRKRNSECRDSSQTSNKTNSPNRCRESRSVGGTPVSLRRNQSENRSTPKLVPLSSRCNSLTFTEIHSIRSRFLAIAESEKALLKADIEADVKYKQLIHEAETILVSMKSTAIRETPVPSPSRRICNVPANKRVEMLRNCEADLRRELSKTQKQSSDLIEITRKETFETVSVPSSPKSTCSNGGRNSPRKTHLTNFINQNVTPADLLRRQTISETQPIEHYEMKRSPRLQLNGNRIKITPPKSPTPRRRFRSQSPRVCIEESDSESDGKSKISNGLTRKLMQTQKRNEINGNKENKLKHSYRKNRSFIEKEDILNENVINDSDSKNVTLDNRPFHSMDMANKYPETYYCPQSEPLKRKIYSEKTLDRLQKSLEMESEIPKKALLEKISLLRRERQQAAASANLFDNPRHEPHQVLNGNDKRQLILSTIEDLKRNWEDQSVELCGLNDD